MHFMYFMFIWLPILMQLPYQLLAVNHFEKMKLNVKHYRKQKTNKSKKHWQSFKIGNSDESERGKWNVFKHGCMIISMKMSISCIDSMHKMQNDILIISKLHLSVTEYRYSVSVAMIGGKKVGIHWMKSFIISISCAVRSLIFFSSRSKCPNAASNRIGNNKFKQIGKKTI